mgnify:FL=1
MRRFSWLPLGVVVVLPWLTWIPWLEYDAAKAITDTPLWIWTVASFGMLGIWLMQWDKWAGLFVAYLAIRCVTYDVPTAYEVLVLTATGVIFLLVVQRTTLTTETVVGWLTITGLWQVAYVVQQAFGMDVLWAGGRALHEMFRSGTLGNANFVGAYLAVIGALAAWWLLPLFLLGLVAAQSVTGLVAFGAALLVRYKASAWVWLTAGISFVAWLLWHGPASWSVRWLVWTRAVRALDWSGWLIGNGLGTWSVLSPTMRRDPRTAGAAGIGELFVHAHNEYLQLLYEAGLIGLGLALIWLVAQRRMFRHPVFGGGAVAVAVSALTMFPFHLAVLSATNLAVLGLAMRDP